MLRPFKCAYNPCHIQPARSNMRVILAEQQFSITWYPHTEIRAYTYTHAHRQYTCTTRRVASQINLVSKEKTEKSLKECVNVWEADSIGSRISDLGFLWTNWIILSDHLMWVAMHAYRVLEYSYFYELHHHTCILTYDICIVTYAHTYFRTRMCRHIHAC